MRESFVQQRRNDEQETEKAPFLVVKKIRDAILDETFKPGDRLPEAELAEMFKVSRSPIREALFALENEGTVIMEPYKGAILKPLSAEEALDIAELRLALITLAAKPAHRHLSPADFDSAYGLAKQITRSNSAKEHFEYNRQLLGHHIREDAAAHSSGGVQTAGRPIDSLLPAVTQALPRSGDQTAAARGAHRILSERQS